MTITAIATTDEPMYQDDSFVAVAVRIPNDLQGSASWKIPMLRTLAAACGTHIEVLKVSGSVANNVIIYGRRENIGFTQMMFLAKRDEKKLPDGNMFTVASRQCCVYMKADGVPSSSWPYSWAFYAGFSAAVADSTTLREMTARNAQELTEIARQYPQVNREYKVNAGNDPAIYAKGYAAGVAFLAQPAPTPKAEKQPKAATVKNVTPKATVIVTPVRAIANEIAPATATDKPQEVKALPAPKEAPKAKAAPKARKAAKAKVAA